MKKRRFWKMLILTTILFFGLLRVPVPVHAASSGSCGSSVNWSLTASGQLNITGSGDMTDYTDTNLAPWYSVRSTVKSIYVTSGVTSIGDLSFYGVAASSVNIASTVTEIGAYSFKNATSLSSVSMSSKVTKIGTEAFYGCSALSTFTFPSTLTEIGEGAFASSGLTTASMSGTKITETSTHLFDGCSSLRTVTLPSTLTEIGEASFSSCSALTSITIPANVTKIGYMAFSYDNKLSKVSLPDAVTEIGAAAFYQNTSLVSINMPSTLESIGYSAFYEDSALTQVDFPEGLKTIGSQAFINSGLTEVILPKTMEYVDALAFGYCANLQRFVALYYNTSIHASAIQDCPKLTEIWGKDYSSARTLAQNYADDGITFYALDTEDAYTCSLSSTSYTYDGSAKTPVVSLTFAGRALSTSDYEVNYVSNVNAGTAQVFVFGAGIYEDYACIKSFTINKASISSASLTLGTTSYTYDGSVKTPSVTLTLSGNTLASVRDYSVTYSNNVNAGTATVSVTATGNYSGTRSTTFSIAKASQNIAGVEASYTLTPGSYTTIAAAAPGALSFTSSDVSVATVDSNGLVTAKAEGTARITINAASNANYNSASKVTNIVVEKASSSGSGDTSGSSSTESGSSGTGSSGSSGTGSTSQTPINLAQCTPVFSDDGLVYNGKARTPSSIALKYQGQTLKEGVDYYYSSITGNVNAGTVTVHFLPVTGGRCYGSVNGTYSIAKAQNSITAINYKKTAAAKAQSFQLAVSRKENASLFYKSNNSNVTVNSSGKITIKAKFIGAATITITSAATTNYQAASKKITVTVLPKKMTLSSAKSKSKKQVNVIWKKDTMVTGYELQISVKKNFSSGTMRKIFKASSSGVKANLSSKKTYYFRIRAYKKYGGKNYYGAWSNVKAAKVK